MDAGDNLVLIRIRLTFLLSKEAAEEQGEGDMELGVYGGLLGNDWLCLGGHCQKPINIWK